jgi:hypothetical protein
VSDDVDDRKTAKELKDRWEKSRRYSERAVLKYAQNVAMYEGDQWMDLDFALGELANLEHEPERMRFEVNRIQSSVKGSQAKLQKRELVFDVVPNDAASTAVIGARKAEAALRHLHRSQRWELLRADWNLKTFLGGFSVGSVDWDPSIGPKLNGKPLGDVRLTISSISECAFAPGVTDVRTARWWIRATTMAPKDAEALYELDSTPKPDFGTLDALRVGDPTGRASVTDHEMCLVLTQYERPGPWGKGGVTTVIGDAVVDNAPWPFPWTDTLNLEPQWETMMPGRWFGETRVSAAVPIQQAYNACWSALGEHLKRAGNVRMLMPTESQVNVSSLTDLPGEILKYWGEKKPEWMGAPGVPGYVVEMIRNLRQELDDALGQQDISRGSAPANAESGLAYQILTEQADTPLMNMAAEQARSWGGIGEKSLLLYEKYATQDRTAAVTVGSVDGLSLKWSGKEIAGQTVVVIPMDNVMPRSRAAQHQFALSLWDKQIVTDPKLIARIGDFPEAASFVEALDPDWSRQERENALLSIGKGDDVEVRDFDNDETHIASIDAFQKTRTYEQLPDDWKQAIDEHKLQHEEALLAKAAKQATNPIFAGLAQADTPPGSATSGSAMGMMPEDQMGMLADPAMQEAPLEEATPEFQAEGML